MTANESQARLKRIFNITITPFIPSGGIDFRGLAESIERLLGMGFNGLLIGGTYGEFPAMSVDERATLFRRVVEIVGGRAPVLLCSAHSDPRVALELTQHATDLGAFLWPRLLSYPRSMTNISSHFSRRWSLPRQADW